MCLAWIVRHILIWVCPAQLVQIDCAWKGQAPFAKQDFNYHHKLVGPTRTDIKPLNILQPEGPSFRVSALIPLFITWHASLQQLGFIACLPFW